MHRLQKFDVAKCDELLTGCSRGRVQPVLLDEDVADAVEIEDRRGVAAPELHLRSPTKRNGSSAQLRRVGV